MGTRRRRTLFVCYFPVGKVLETLGKTRDMRVIFFSKKGERDKRSRRERMKDWGGGGHENKKRGRKGKLWVGGRKAASVRRSCLGTDAKKLFPQVDKGRGEAMLPGDSYIFLLRRGRDISPQGQLSFGGNSLCRKLPHDNNPALPQ